MADGGDDPIAALPRPRPQSTIAAVLLAVAGWAHLRIFTLEGQLAETRSELAAITAATTATTKAIDGAIAELKAAAAEQRSATARLEVTIAELRGRRR